MSKQDFIGLPGCAANDMPDKPEWKVSRRGMLAGSAGLALASFTVGSGAALAQAHGPGHAASGNSATGSSRIYPINIVDGVPDIAHDPANIPAPLARNTPETVRVDLETIELEARLDDRTTYRFWTFNGTVPGPFVRVRVGDTVEVHLKNNEDSMMMHNVDFHAATGPGGGAAATSALPGEGKSFSFKALSPGIFVYHCAVPPVASHIANGMYGLILVEPEAGLPPVDREFYVMQGEIYTEEPFGTQGLLTESYEKLLNERPEYFVFNGHVASLTEHFPLRARVGETVRIFFGVGGPNFTSSFHVIGEIFDKAYQMGSVVSPPVEGVQSISVPPGAASIVEFALEVPGTYVLVDHALSRAERGLAGYLIVEGPEDKEIFDAPDNENASGH